MMEEKNKQELKKEIDAINHKVDQIDKHMNS